MDDQDLYREAAERDREGLPDPARLVEAYVVSLIGLAAFVVVLVVVYRS